jgi:hypothetical protein
VIGRECRARARSARKGAVAWTGGRSLDRSVGWVEVVQGVLLEYDIGQKLDRGVGGGKECR